ncbi:MAG: phytoene desaturase family protein [Thermodesulfobacteriota bacterium]|nr:phytoene desaturase family protein [Thermodesulfobacteriota bacterium]
MTRPKAIVIGGGLGGLSIALRLVVRNWEVTVYEKGATMGGKMNSWSQKNFTFDTGPSLITMPWIFSELFESVGEHINDYLLLQLAEPLAHYVFDDGFHFQVSAYMPQWLKTLKEIEPQGEQHFLEFMHLGARLFNLSLHTFFRRSPLDPPDIETFSALKHMPFRHAWGRYDRTIYKFFRSPYLRRMYERFPTYVGSSPYRIPATLTLIPFLEHAFGGWYVKGGLYGIIKSLEALLQKRGVLLHTGRRVHRIISNDGRIMGIELEDGSFHGSNVVIMNGDASLARVLLGEYGAAPLPESDRSLSGFIMLIGVKRRLPELAHHTVYFSADYREEFSELFDRRRFPEDPTVYVSMPSKSDRTVAPHDGETLFIMANAPANDSDDWNEQEISSARRLVFQRLHRGGFPDIDRDTVVSTVWTPRKIQESYDMPGGAIYGTHSHGWRKAFLRPFNKDRRHQGLYYVGGSTHPGGGTPTVLMSAQITSELIKKYEGT